MTEYTKTKLSLRFWQKGDKNRGGVQKVIKINDKKWVEKRKNFGYWRNMPI